MPYIPPQSIVDPEYYDNALYGGDSHENSDDVQQKAFFDDSHY
jgi:hypothetical protein